MRRTAARSDASVQIVSRIHSGTGWLSHASTAFMLMDVLFFTERVARRIAISMNVSMATNCEFAPNTFERCFFAAFGLVVREEQMQQHIANLC